VGAVVGGADDVDESWRSGERFYRQLVISRGRLELVLAIKG
jgi:hypothetical protein